MPRIDRIILLLGIVSWLLSFGITLKYLKRSKALEDASVDEALAELIKNLKEPDTSTEATRRVLFIAANGNLAWGKKEVFDQISAFKKHGAEITLIGDGSSNINEKMILDAANSISDDSRPITVVVLAHGLPSSTQGGHVITLGVDNILSEQKYDTCSLLKDLDSTLGNSGANVSFFIESCFGGAVLECGRAIGSDIVTIAPATMPSLVKQFVDFSASLTSSSTLQDLSASNLLEFYLMHTSSMRLNIATPNMSKKGVLINSDMQLSNIINIPMNEQERRSLHSELDPIMGADEVTRVLELITSGRSFSIKALGDYGKALLIALKIAEGDLNLKVYHESKNPNASPSGMKL